MLRIYARTNDQCDHKIQHEHIPHSPQIGKTALVSIDAALWVRVAR